MKRLFSITITSICCLLLLNFVHTKLTKNIIAQKATIDPVKIEEYENESKEDGIAQAQQMEFELTKDVSLGYIPKYRLVNAYQNLMTERKLIPNTPNNVSAFLGRCFDFPLPNCKATSLNFFSSQPSPFSENILFNSL